MNVHVFHDIEMKDAIAEHNEHFNCTIDGSLDTTDALTVYPKTAKNCVAIILHENCSNNLICNIHHESIHAAMYILHQRGVVISYENDEAITYLSTYIFKKICKKLELI